MTSGIGSLSLPGRVVLLSVVQLSLADETPAHTGQVILTCSETLRDVDIETIGKPSEAEVNKALNRLESEGLVVNTDDSDASPVGKGRPMYELGLGAEAVLDALADDEDVAPLIERVRQSV